jgi:hypothetical protein
MERRGDGQKSGYMPVRVWKSSPLHIVYRLHCFLDEYGFFTLKLMVCVTNASLGLDKKVSRGYLELCSSGLTLDREGGAGKGSNP